MPRLMSVSLTTEAVLDRTKTVTRRDGWRFLRPGDRLTLCRKVMGRKLGEPLERLAEVEVISVRRERLDTITAEDVEREGLAPMTPAEFVAFFCDTHKRVTPASEVTRIEWRYLLETPTSVPEHSSAPLPHRGAENGLERNTGAVSGSEGGL